MIRSVLMLGNELEAERLEFDVGDDLYLYLHLRLARLHVCQLEREGRLGDMRLGNP